MKSRYQHLEQDRRSMPTSGGNRSSSRLRSSDMQPMLDQEKNFFELTKTIMKDGDFSLLNFKEMSNNTVRANEFFQTLVSREHLDERLGALYLQTCKVECVVRFVIKKLLQWR